MTPEQDLQIPQSPGSEATLIGSVLADPKQFKQLALTVLTGDFWDDAHQAIWKSMSWLHKAGVLPDEIAVIDRLIAENQIGAAGGAAYITALSSRIINPQSARHYAQLVVETSRKRSLIDICRRTMGSLCAGENPDQAIATLNTGIDQVAERGTRPDEIETFADVATDEVERLIALYKKGGVAAARGFSCGIKFINDAMNGLQRKDLITVAARPGTGKTHWVLYMLGCAMADGATVGLISLDMSRDRFLNYAVPSLANVGGENITKGDMYKPWDFSEIIEARYRDAARAADPHRRFLAVTRPQSKALSAISGYIGRMKSAGASVIAIDQTQNIEEWRQGLRDKNRGVLSAVVGEIKEMADDYNVTIMLLHQIGRTGADHPTVQDLSETDAFNMRSDFILLLHDWQRAYKDTFGGWMQGREPWQYRAPKASEEGRTDITNPRFIRVDLAKSRSSESVVASVPFDYRRGVRVEYDRDTDTFLDAEIN